MALTETQALSKKGLSRLLVKYQSYLFLPLLCLKGVSLRLAGVHYLLNTRTKYRLTESLLLASHGALYFTILFYLLDPWHAIGFLVVHQALFGLNMGLVFAPNHKGMPLLDKDDEQSFLQQQVITARNLKSNLFIDIFYGGLNYQIEHHLFPSMPRNKLGQARKIIKPFCQERSISYHETSVARSLAEIMGYLHQISAPLRVSPSARRLG